jgi:glycine/D-amino acid oxidase-like deaminating enzyme
MKTQCSKLKRERIAEIVRMMRQLRFDRGTTDRELAERWGLALGTVEHYAAEAHRTVVALIEDDDDMRALSLAAMKENARQLTIIGAQALSDAKVLKPQQRAQLYRAAIDAIRAKGEAVRAITGIAGVDAPTKIEFGGTLENMRALLETEPPKRPT